MEITIDCTHVGHGDCTIISLDNKSTNSKWTCIIDSGNGKTKANNNIEQVIKERKIKKFNLAILSHFDIDHIGGFDSLINVLKIPIDAYWSPYTFAIERNLWLFGLRGRQAVERAKILENKLQQKGTLLYSPVEGYNHSPMKGFRIEVLFPTIKLYRALLEKTSTEIFENFDSTLSELVEQMNLNIESIDEGTNTYVKTMYNHYSGGIIFRDLAAEKKHLRHNLEVETKSRIDSLTEPEFFGNKVLNNTSLVIRFEVWTGTQWYSLLFPGDMENWLYLMARRGNRLKTNFYKASHHGGRVYINGDKEANHEVLQAIRPDVVMISANGQHKLPKSTTKLALEKWGASVFCTQTKMCEILSMTGEKIYKEECCKNSYECLSTGYSTCFRIYDGKIIVNKQSCISNSGYSNYPILQMEQHFIPDSKVLLALTETEVNKHTEWMVTKIEEVHEERLKNIKVEKSEVISSQFLHKISLQDKRNINEKKISDIIEYGYAKNKFWMLNDSWGHRPEKGVYKIADDNEIAIMEKIVLRFDKLMFIDTPFQNSTKEMLLNVLAQDLFKLIQKGTGFPEKIIEKFCWPLILLKIYKQYNYIYYEMKSWKVKKGILVMIKAPLIHGSLKKMFELPDEIKDSYYIKNYPNYEWYLDSILRGRGSTFLAQSSNIKTIEDLGEMLFSKANIHVLNK